MSTDLTSISPQVKSTSIDNQRAFGFRTPRLTPFQDVNGQSAYRIDRVNPITKQIESVTIYWDKLSEEERPQFIEQCIEKATIDVEDLTHQVERLGRDVKQLNETTDRQYQAAQKILAVCLNSPHLKGIDIYNLKKYDPKTCPGDPRLYYDVTYDPWEAWKEKNQAPCLESCWTSIKSFCLSAWDELMKFLSSLWGSCCGKD